ncbi:MAG TPA: tetratricopeptide repeat protein [Anaerolineae bacterium]|nr:tetratricopeptide repeat protein [Anaerolineae bacterium]
MSRLTLYLFGPPRLELDGAPVAIDRRKALALLVYLAVTRQSHSRESLAALFWPDYDQSRAYAYLRRTLWEINQALGEGWVMADRETVGLNPAVDPSSDSGQALWLDVARFRNLIAERRKHGQGCAAGLSLLTEAVELYQNHFLAGFNLKDAPDFDEWVFFEAEGLRRDLAGALETLARCLSEQGDTEASISYARRWLALDTLNEAAHRQLMGLYEQAGQHNAALRQYQECTRILHEELGAIPQAETTALYERIKADGGRTKEEGKKPASSLIPHPPSLRHNLPPQPTPFIGRADELGQIAALLSNPDCRLLTLIGPGGAGKTRVALQAAGAQLAAFSDGAFFAPLASVGDPAFVVSAIADAVGFSFCSPSTAADQPTQKRQLLNFLSQKHMLLALDNFEHLLPAASLLTDILQAAPRVKIVATSRERLNLQDEWVLTIAGMRVPASDAQEDAQAYSSVQLFVQNARKAVVGFMLTEKERPSVVRICQLVEGLPLGLELAAAWVKLLSCRDIAEEIERSLDFLATTLRDVPERHQSLRAVFESSWNLLGAPEQDAFRRLSAFRGGFQREAALAVAGATLPVLAALVDKSLLYRRDADRYELHEVLRQYAAEKLDAAPDDKAQTLARHSAAYAGLVYARLAPLYGRGQKQALEQIAAEIENIQAGWRWAVTQRDAVRAEEYLEGLFRFYDARSRFQEAEELSRQALAAFPHGDDSSEDETAIAGQLLGWHSHFCYQTGRLALASDHMRQALACVRRLGPRHRHALAFVNLLAIYWQGIDTTIDAAEARRMARDNLAYYRAQHNCWGIAQMLIILAWEAEWQGSRSRAKRLYRQALKIQREIGDDLGAARALNWLGELQHHIGEYAEARQSYQASLDLSREFDDRWAMSQSLDYSGYVARRMGDHAEARRRHEESLAISTEIGDRLGIAGSLDNLGLVACDTGDFAEAERLFQEGLALRREAGHAWSIAISLDHLAGVALASGDLARAEQALHESLALDPESLSALSRLGELRAAQGNLLEAREHYRRVLEMARQGQEWPVVLEALTGIAALHAQAGEGARAAELLAFIGHQPASDYATRTKARRLLDEVSAQLTPEALAEAEARGRAGTLEAMLATV